MTRAACGVRRGGTRPSAWRLVSFLRQALPGAFLLQTRRKVEGKGASQSDTDAQVQVYAVAQSASLQRLGPNRCLIKEPSIPRQVQGL